MTTQESGRFYGNVLGNETITLKDDSARRQAVDLFLADWSSISLSLPEWASTWQAPDYHNIPRA